MNRTFRISQFLVKILVLCHLITLTHSWEMGVEENTIEINMDRSEVVPYNITGSCSNSAESCRVILELMTDHEDIATVKGSDDTSLQILLDIKNGYGNGSFTLEAVFLGHTRLIITLTEEANGKSQELDTIDVIVKREKRPIDSAFTGSVAVLVSLIYINFGCALDWSALRPILKRPVGPAIGFIGQFLIMPGLSYAVGLAVFSSRPDLRLGMLFAGVSPAGGASNVWTVLLDGNIDLSITMTTISTLAAFGMMPLWLFTVGPSIFEEARIEVPYSHIASLAAALVIPLFIGWLIQRFLPRISALLVRILKGFSALLILFIVIFAIVTNLYLFKLATWRIGIAGLLLPWCGYSLGATLAMLLRQSGPDVRAIAIETGVQNTGIAIFLLRFTLPQPQGDLATIVPVAIAVMTPIPLAAYWAMRKFCCRKNTKQPLEIDNSSQLDVVR